MVHSTLASIVLLTAPLALLPLSQSGSAVAPPPASPPAAPAGTAPLPIITVERDDLVVTTSCQLAFPATPIADANGNGVVHIEGSGITVDLGGGTLRGADPKAEPDSFTGTGIVVTGSNVILRNGKVRGFRCGILATGSEKSTFEKLDLSGNYAMRLRSTVDAEDGGDWLWPHENDKREWVTRYGAGLCIERSTGVTVRDVKVRQTQNGIILDRVDDSRIYDNDCSFLSGWGVAMWRSSNNIVCRNALDFCIRGYSHGVYNRGQDSAGLLIFEQCSKNTIALNSMTHGGDGLFGFAGKEALGERPAANAPADFSRRRGCNDNLIIGNDFSFAAAHGLEMTFSFGNQIAHNTFEENGICGIWGGYSQSTVITENRFIKNGGGDSHGEGGAIDIEHGSDNRIIANTFRGERVAIEFWWDDDKALLAGPWAKANGGESKDNIVAKNTFDACGTALGVLLSKGTVFVDNTSVNGADAKVEHDDSSELVPAPEALTLPTVPSPTELASKLPGNNDPIGKGRALGGREAIRMTPWGPWDGTEPLLVLDRSAPDKAVWKLIGATSFKGAEVAGGGSLRINANLSQQTVGLTLEMPGQVAPYLLRTRFDGKVLFGEGCVYSADWQVAFFPSTVDPRSNLEVWRDGATAADSVTVIVPAIDFQFGNEGPASLKLPDLAGETLKSPDAAKLGSDHFGTIAKCKLAFPKGTFTLRTMSDDGVRVTVDGKTVIEDWTWHAPRESRGTVTFDEPKEVEVVVEHFELDGFSTLRLFIDGELDARRKAAFGR